MLAIRWIKRNAHLNRETRRYLSYAVGELLLVVAGILIALQIDNWSTAREEQATLHNYLQAIARNMRDDVVALEALTAARGDALRLTNNVQLDLLYRTRFSADDIDLFNRAIRAAEQLRYFNANTSAFDALKVSGVLDELQGLDVEPVLSRYYLGALKARQLEDAFNTRLLAMEPTFELVTETAIEPFAVFDPSALAPGRIEELQGYYREYFNSAYPQGLLEHARNASAILREYQQLLSLARLFIDTIESAPGSVEGNVQRRLSQLDAIAAGAGPAYVVREGRVNHGLLSVEIAAAFFVDRELIPRAMFIDPDYASAADDSLRLAYRGGALWAAFFFAALDRPNTLGRAALDFSRFDRVRLEIRGETGGERLLVHMKDKDDPDDGSQTNLEIVLSDQWQTFEFRLSDFDNADPSMLNTVLGFLMIERQEPLALYIRTLRFLRPGE